RARERDRQLAREIVGNGAPQLLLVFAETEIHAIPRACYGSAMPSSAAAFGGCPGTGGGMGGAAGDGTPAKGAAGCSGVAGDGGVAGCGGAAGDGVAGCGGA